MSGTYHTGEDHSPCSFYQSNTNLIQKHPYRDTQNDFWPNIWASHGPVKLTYEINYHRLKNWGLETQTGLANTAGLIRGKAENQTQQI
jgi:hypothetical protein